MLRLDPTDQYSIALSLIKGYGNIEIIIYYIIAHLGVFDKLKMA